MNGFFNPGMSGAGNMVNMDLDMNPGFVSMDVCNPCCPPVQPVCPPHHCGKKKMHHHEHPQPTLYVVQKGDSVFKIARKFGTTMQAIVIANNLRNPDLIYPGQTLIIPGA